MFNNVIKSEYLSRNRRGMVRLYIIPLLVWLFVLAGVTLLFNTRIQRFEVVGMAYSKAWQVSVVETGRIKTLHVDLFDSVAKGQVIVSLRSEHIEARLNTIKAEVAKLSAEINAAKDLLDVETHDRHIDLVTEYRRFSANVESARLEILELKAVIEPDRILLKDFLAEINIERELLINSAISSTYKIEKAQAQHDTLARKIEENELILAQAEKNLAQARKRRDEFLNIKQVNPSPGIAIEAIHKAIDVQQHLMQELIVQGETLTLTAPADGIVTEIIGRAGEVVTPGLAILTISQRPTEIIAYAGDATHNAVKQGQKVQVVKNGFTPQVAESQIVQIGPAIDAVPERLQANPNFPQWGRPFLIKIPPGMTLVPGEKVGIRGLHR
ncbi:MAG: HlyD family efflux transporter periplasmic adaptor subunit [Planctomycetes bacterium]|nr:HlyD family efflux transporter periplasmic adaptor subunit [Planctomycetota bacterium]